ncbi:MAG: hypothetical protein KatS3mg085_015 [Candidatus Dojkabacteria bacterium]|nr:MAG: hypothetical protein KatS3mg085_015 [Candidatus Dojkabacteria bacterium]
MKKNNKDDDNDNLNDDSDVTNDAHQTDDIDYTEDDTNQNDPLLEDIDADSEVGEGYSIGEIVAEDYGEEDEPPVEDMIDLNKDRSRNKF